MNIAGWGVENTEEEMVGIGGIGFCILVGADVVAVELFRYFYGAYQRKSKLKQK